MSEEDCGFRRLLRSCSSLARRPISSVLPSNPHTADESEILGSSVDWLSSRVQELLEPSAKCGRGASTFEWSQRRDYLLRQSILGKRSGHRSSAMLPARRRSSAMEASRVGLYASTRANQRRRARCLALLLALLKRLQAATRNPDTAALIITDDTVCRLLPMAICSSYFDMSPAAELLLAKTLSNLSCQQQSYYLLTNNNFLCNLVDGWISSPCLLLSLCGGKIAANMSTYSLLATLDPAGSCRPYCIYQPDVYELYRPYLTVPLMDVVFINGMLGSVFYTWKQGVEDGTEGCSECWPRDWLAEDLPRARLLALNMKIAVFKCRSCTADQDTAGCLPRRAKEALAQLLAAGVGHRLTAFVCHSFGGLIVKQLLQTLHAAAGEDPVKRRFLDSVHGIVFVAVPHLGRSRAINVNRCYWRPLRSTCLSEEANNVFDGSCRVLIRLHAWFVQYAQTRTELRVLNLIELDKTRVVPGGFCGLRVCPETWVDKLVGDIVRIPLDHIMICKPPSRDHDSYTVVRDFLGELSNRGSGWRPALLTGGFLGGSVWHRPERSCEEELRLRYGVSSARCLWTSSAWHKFRAKNRPRFYDMI